MYALVDIKGKQYKVEKGSMLRVDKLNAQDGDEVEFDTVLMISSDAEPVIGTPYVKNARVLASVGPTVRSRKIKVLKFKRRKGYERKQGHRQSYSVLKIRDIRTA